MDTTKIRAVLFTGKTYKDGSHPIMIRITQNRKRIYKAVGHSVVPDAWDDDNQRVYEQYPKISKRQEGNYKPEKIAELKGRYKHAVVLHNAGRINSDIKDKLDEVEGIGEKLKVNNESLDLKNIKTKLNPQLGRDRNESFTAFGEEYRDKYLALGSIGTYKSYKSTLAKLNEFIGGKDLLFSDITVQFLQQFNVHLISAKSKGQQQIKGLKTNSAHKYLKGIKAIYYEAIAQQIISGEKNPFLVFKLKLDKNVKKSRLTIEEIIAIEGLDLKKDSVIWHARNFFLFSFYCAGIRASDMFQLKWMNVSAEGRLEYHMDKTGQYKSISLTAKANAILKQYKIRDSQPNAFIFPFINTNLDLKDRLVLFNQISSCTALVNKYLKEISKVAKIDKVISTHIARHSFADVARTRKASVYDISKMLGHSSIKITEAYLASLDVDSQDEAMRKY